MAGGAGESKAVYCGEVPKRCLFPKGNLGAEVFINDIWGVPTEKRGSGSHTHGMVQLLGPVVLGASGCPPEGHEHPWVPSEV